MRSVEVTVFWADAARPDVCRPAPDLLDPRETARAARIVHEPDRRASLCAALLLRLAVAEVTGAEPRDVRVERRCPDCARWHGRPEVVDPAGVQVSVTHCGQRVAVAVSGGDGAVRLGIDVESLAAVGDPPDERLVATVLDPAERERNDAWTAAGLGRYWVAKEALLKAAGTGLRQPMTSVRLSPARDSARLDGRSATVVPLARCGPGHVAALALLADGTAPTPTPLGAGTPSPVVTELDGGVLLGRMSAATGVIAPARVPAGPSPSRHGTGRCPGGG